MSGLFVSLLWRVVLKKKETGAQNEQQASKVMETLLHAFIQMLLVCLRYFCGLTSKTNRQEDEDE